MIEEFPILNSESAEEGSSEVEPDQETLEQRVEEISLNVSESDFLSYRKYLDQFREIYADLKEIDPRKALEFVAKATDLSHEILEFNSEARKLLLFHILTGSTIDNSNSHLIESYDDPAINIEGRLQALFEEFK